MNQSTTPTLANDDETINAIAEIDINHNSLFHLVFHRLFARHRVPLSSNVIFAYSCCLVLTILPLNLSAFIELPLVIKSTDSLKLPYLCDWNLHFMFFVSLPLLVLYTLTDQQHLSTVLNKVIRENVIHIDSKDVSALVSSWKVRFGYINICSQLIGGIVGIIVAFGNYKAYSDPQIGLWTINNQQFSFTGWVYLYCIFVFYCTVTIYIIRTVSVSFMFNDFVNKTQKIDEHFHADNCNGLSPIGTFGLRTQYILTAFIINLIILFYVYHEFIIKSDIVLSLVVSALIACVVLGPIVFFVPFLPFHYRMKDEKEKLINDISLQLRSEIERIRNKFHHEQMSKEDEEVIERLKKLRALLEELPVWPFNARTIKKYVTAYMTPLSLPLLKMLFGMVIK